MRLDELAARLGCELCGDGAVEITGVGPIEAASAGQVTFVANRRYQKYLAATGASAVILGNDAEDVALPALRCSDPYLAFARAIEIFYRPIQAVRGIHPTAVVAGSAAIGAGASIGPYAVVGEDVVVGNDARIGAHVVIYPETTIGDRFCAHAHVTVRERSVIGNDVILHAGVVIGSDGFGYVAGGGEIRKIIQAGNVVLEDGVEVGANATIDRAAVGSTILRRGVKIDNLVMIAHGCEIGAGSMIAAQAGLSGSTRVGRFVRMGGQVGSAGHLTIGDGAQIAAQSGIANSVAPGAIVGGYPAVDITVWRRMAAALPRLAEALRRLRRLERRVGLDGDKED